MSPRGAGFKRCVDGCPCYGRVGELLLQSNVLSVASREFTPMSAAYHTAAHYNYSAHLWMDTSVFGYALAGIFDGHLHELAIISGSGILQFIARFGRIQTGRLWKNP